MRILELGCKRPGEISLNFSVNVRGSKCKPKSYVALDKNTRSVYHVDLELSDRSREDSRFGYPFGNCIGGC